MVGIAGCITERPNEGLLAISGPVSFVVELPGVPDNFEKNLGGTDRMACWAGSCRIDVNSSLGKEYLLKVKNYHCERQYLPPLSKVPLSGYAICAM